MARSLVIVESPAKAKTINKYLGRNYMVKASYGHVMDLPKKELGINIKRGFEPTYEVSPEKAHVVEGLQKAAQKSEAVYLAADPDREGEAICAHLAEVLKPTMAAKNGSNGAGKKKKKKTRKGQEGTELHRNHIFRVMFNEITPRAIRAAFEHPGEINENLVDAQQARRVLDRLVGYKISPLLWDKVRKGISAGRVQTVALRLIVEREREIRAFTPVEYWTIEALLEKNAQQFTAKLHHIDGKKPEIPNEAAAQRILNDLKGKKTFDVTEVKRRERRKNPSAPFTTSTLQQEAAKKLSFGSKRTMRVAQDLYEGIEIGDEGGVGLITYMRTDSTRVAESAAGQARDYLRTLFGEDFLALGLQLYSDGKSKNAQDAHESIRPTDPSRRPDEMRKYLTPDQF